MRLVVVRDIIVAFLSRVGIPAMIDDRADAPFGLAFVGDAGHTRFAAASVLAGVLLVGVRAADAALVVQEGM